MNKIIRFLLFFNCFVVTTPADLSFVSSFSTPVFGEAVTFDPASGNILTTGPGNRMDYFTTAGVFVSSFFVTALTTAVTTAPWVGPTWAMARRKRPLRPSTFSLR